MRECMAEGCPHLAADGCDYCHQHDEPPAVMPVSEQSDEQETTGVLRRWTEFCVPCDSFVFTVHKGHGSYSCQRCGAKVVPVVLVTEADYQERRHAG